MLNPILRLRAKGPLACFTRPELKVERVSYPVITPSAARGIFEAILWKPAIKWNIQCIFVEKEINFVSIRRNEVNNKIAVPSAATIQNGGYIKHYYIEEDHTQRNTVALYDVQYVIEASIELTVKAGAEDNITKFTEMFKRRLEHGQYFHHPYFGCREFVAEVTPVNEPVKTVTDSRNLGLMLWDIEYGEDQNRPIFFAAKLKQGILNIPSSLIKQVTDDGGIS